MVNPQMLQIGLFGQKTNMKISLIFLVVFCTFAVTSGYLSVDGHNGVKGGQNFPGFGYGVKTNPGRKHGHEKLIEKTVEEEIDDHHQVPEYIKKLFIRKADKTVLLRQKQILTLLYHINQESDIPEHIEIAKTFSPLESHNANLYLKNGVFEKFRDLWKYSPLAKGAIFSIFNANHLHHAMALSKLLYFAKDYDTFYKTAVWARMHVNEGLFTYSLYIAVVHRPDTKEVMLPPIYEVSPHLFFSADVIKKAQYYKQIHETNQHDQGKGFNGYTIDSDYSNGHMNLDHEQTSLAYYLEDIGVNAFSFNLHINFPFWMNATEFGWSKLPRGALYYLFFQNTWARYHLERIAHGYDEIDFLNWDLPVKTAYHSNLAYPNGVRFPNRPKFAKLHEYFYNYGQSRWAPSVYGYSYSYVNDFERRIIDVIESGAYWNEEEGKLVKLESDEFFNVLGNIIEGNRDSPNFNYYHSIWYFARHLLGYSTQQLDQNECVPSALEHFETSLRDPVFYQLLKKLMIVPYQRYLERIPPYTKDELVFPGVEITKVEVDRLVTYNDTFYSNLINSVYYKPNEFYGDFQVRVRQSRLNHAPFEIKMHLKSDKTQKAGVKIFIGPKYDRDGRPFEISENRLNLIYLDSFVTELQAGDNIVTRKSSENMFFAPDKVSYVDLYEKTVAALKGVSDFYVDLRQNFYGYPQRFILPKGSACGTPYQLFFVVYPYSEYQTKHTHYLDTLITDNYPLSYPLDRFIKLNKMWEEIPNFHFEEVKIYFE